MQYQGLLSYCFLLKEEPSTYPKLTEGLEHSAKLTEKLSFAQLNKPGYA